MCALSFRTFSTPWLASSEGRESPFMDWGAKSIARGNIFGSGISLRSAFMAGDSMVAQDLGDRDRHGDGYAMRGKSTVL